MWQEIIVGLIGIAVVCYIARNIYRKITAPKNTNNFCSGCSGCSMKEEVRKKKACCAGSDKTQKNFTS